MKRLIGVGIAFPVLAASLVSAAHAGEPPSSYPSRPVRVVVPFPPGGGTDTVARAIAHKLSVSLGQQFVVDNRAGAGGIVGTQIAARAAPDGYTLLLGTSSGLVINPLLNVKLPYHPVKDFAPVSLLATNPTLLVVHPSVPARSGRLRALAVGSPQRSRAVPDIPTVAEAGVPGFQTVTWFGVFAPARTPANIIGTLNGQIAQALEDRDLAQNLVSQGSEPGASTPARLAQYIREDSERWERVIRTAKIKVE